MKNWRWLVASFIALLIICSFYPYGASAEQSSSILDDQFQEFSRHYQKQEDTKQFQIAGVRSIQDEIYERRIIVKTAPDFTFDPASFNVMLVEGMPHLRKNDLFVVQLPEEVSYDAKLKELKDEQGILNAEPDYIVEDAAAAVTKDPLSKDQWYLSKIQLSKAWTINKGSADTTIAVVDSGVNASHLDLKDRVLKGYDFVSGLNNGHRDELGHGTHVAGIIAANVNDIGIAGIDQGAKVLPVKAMGKKGTGTLSNVIDGLYYAIEQDADIINMSYVIKEENGMLEEVLWKAYDKGIVLIASSGNKGTEEQMYPGSYKHVINVGATDRKDKRAEFSNYGTWLDMAAPGDDILSTHFKGDYQFDSGTSFSAPIVSGIAGLTVAEHPEWTPDEVRWALESGADKTGDYEWEYDFGYGRANALNTLKASPPETGKPGSFSKEAIELKSGEQLSGNMELPMDADWYSFTVKKNSKLTIDITNNSLHADLIGVLYRDMDGEFIEEEVIDDFGMGDDEQLELEVKKGNYYFAVFEYHGRWSNDSYDIQANYDTDNPGKQLYSDVTVYEKEIGYLSEMGIISGFPDGKFKPKADVSRLQVIRMILREKGIDIHKHKIKNPELNDVKPGDEGYEDIAIAVELGIIKGKDNQTFDRWGSVTRAQMAAILVRAYGMEGASTTEFIDVSPTYWAYTDIQTLVANKIARGYPDHTFRPYQPISRQHFSRMLYNKIKVN